VNSYNRRKDNGFGLWNDFRNGFRNNAQFGVPHGL